MRNDDIFSLSHLSACYTTWQVLHSTSLSSAVIGQLKRSHDTQGTHLFISDVQKTLYQSDITHNMQYIYIYIYIYINRT